ncbi:basic proline-rich protein-like [Dipodomys spectabilis]|uniref:basic proline-rich protein-like n=1 Tax=Dipodomys spectabilis TaxID=105255 RepID=UPI001C5495D2|nr:basic proline-rich protein-like [Dipodomys spectabilis]
MTSLTSPKFKGTLKARQIAIPPPPHTSSSEEITKERPPGAQPNDINDSTGVQQRLSQTSDRAARGATTGAHATVAGASSWRPRALFRTGLCIHHPRMARSSADSERTGRRQQPRPSGSAAPCRERRPALAGVEGGGEPEPVTRGAHRVRSGARNADGALALLPLSPPRCPPPRPRRPAGLGSRSAAEPGTRSSGAGGGGPRAPARAHLPGPRARPGPAARPPAGRQHRGQRRLTCRAAPLRPARPQRRSRCYPTSIFSRFKGRTPPRPLDQLFLALSLARSRPGSRRPPPQLPLAVPERGGGRGAASPSPASSRAPLRPSRPSAPPEAARSARLPAPPPDVTGPSRAAPPSPAPPT